MPYTGTPRTWTAGGSGVGAADFNSEIRDPLTAITGAWTSYTPALTGFTTGSGTLAGGYMQANHFVTFWAQFTFGAGSAAASAIPTLTLPVSAKAVNTGVFVGIFGDASPGATYNAVPFQLAVGTVGLSIPGTSGVYTTPSTTTPFTWTTSDYVLVRGVYEAA